MNNYRRRGFSSVTRGQCWFGASLLIWGTIAAAADGPQEWLNRMGRAAMQVSYHGTLVHTCDGVVDVVQIVHRIENGRVSERITSRDVAGREIIRNPDEVMCVLPEQNSVVVETRPVPAQPEGSPISTLPSFSNVDTTTYKLAMLQPDRIAGQETEVIAVRPVDEYRYGYRLWLDRTTAMTLKFELLGETGDTLEQILFTAIEFSDQIPAADVSPSLPMDTFRRQQSRVSVEPAVGSADSREGLAQWRATKLPAGFKLTVRRAKTGPGSTQPMEQLVYSDGLGSVSVFIETGVAEAELAEGLSRFGATNAYTTTMEDHLITAVGYVPVRTVKMIALSVRPVAESP
jgi:sigma-E factor negative regulatory protein RseB